MSSTEQKFSVPCAFVFPDDMPEGESEMRGRKCGMPRDFWWHDDRADEYAIQHEYVAPE